MAKMYDKVTINGTDVTVHRITWDTESEWKYAIDSLNIDFSPKINNVLTLTPGMRIIVTRGYVTDTDEYVIDGDITQVNPQVDRINCVCKGRMIDAVKYGRTKSWDKDIDPQAGIGSEIFKDILDHSQLNYDSTTVPSTGTDPADLIVKFIQNDQDDFQMLDSLSNTYERVIVYDYQTGKVNWLSKGFVTYSHPLVVGTDIQNQPKWKENMEQLINLVKVNGATVYDKINPPVFAGPATEFSLDKTPEDTEVRQGSGTGTLYVRGQKGVGTLGLDFDYYVDTEQKKLIFATNKSNIWVRYGAQVPMPVLLRNQTSIDTYGGPNKIPHFRSFTYNDIKDVNDAEDRARTILNKYSTPFMETREDLQIDDVAIQTYGVIKPGYLINIVDNFNNKNLNVFVKIVKKSIPHIGDRITVGDEIWRTEDWQAEQMKKINLLFADLNKNQDILISGFDFTYAINFKNRYSYLEKRSIAGEIGIYGNPTQGIYGLSKYGSYSSLLGFILGSPLSGKLGINKYGQTAITWNTVKMVQGNNIYQEYVTDTLFYDSLNSSGITWNTTTKTITFAAGGILTTNALTAGVLWSSVLLSFGAYTGSFTSYEISNDDKTTWESLSYNTVYNIVTTNIGKFYLRITAGLAGATISNTYDSLSSNALVNPAISLTFA